MIRQLTCSALLFLAMHAGAQDRGPPPRGPPMDEIASAVGLKDNQRASVQAALEQHHAAMMALHEAMRSKHHALDQQLHTSLSRVLTPDQLTRFEGWRQIHPPSPPPDGQGGLRDRRGPPGGQSPRSQFAQDGQYGQGGPDDGGQGRRPPPPGGPGNGNDRPPPPPDNDWNDSTQNPPPPPPRGA